MDGKNPFGSTGRKIRVGIIGCDSSHTPEFTTIIQQAPPESVLSTLEIAAAFPTASKDIPASRDRVGDIACFLRDRGVCRVNSLTELLPLVDAILIASLDGRKHLAQIKPVLEAGKPVFVDKPVAASLADAIQIFRLAEQMRVPCFSSSALRFCPEFSELHNGSVIGRVLGCSTYSPCSLEPHHPDLFWYGIHGRIAVRHHGTRMHFSDPYPLSGRRCRCRTLA